MSLPAVRRLVPVLCALTAAAALLAPATASASIPKKVTSVGLGMRIDLIRGTKLSLALLPGKKGPKNLKPLRNKDVVITCEGYDATGQTWHIEVGVVHIAKAANGIHAKLRTAIAASYCEFLPPKKSALINAQFNNDDPAHKTVLDSLGPLLNKQYDVVDALYTELHRNPTPQEIVDRFASTGYTPPWPAAAMTSAAQFGAAGQAGIWTDDLQERVSTTDTDGAPVAMTYDYNAVRKTK